MIKYALAAALIASLGLGGWAVWQTRKAERLAADNARLEADNARLASSLAAMEMQAAQAREAANVARATIERERTLNAEYAAIRAALENGDTDAPIPDWFRDHLSRLGLLGDDTDGLRGADCAGDTSDAC